MSGSELRDSGHKKNGSHSTLRGFFSSSSSSLHKEGKQNKENGVGTSPSHRFFLRKRNSRGSISPQNSSTSSLNSFMRKNNKVMNIRQDNVEKGSASFYNSDIVSSDYSNEGTENENIISSRNQSNSNTNITSNGSFNFSESQTSLPKGDSRVLSGQLTGQRYPPQSDYADEKHERRKEEGRKTHKREHHHGHLSLKRFLKKLKHIDSSGSKHKHKPILPQHSSSDLYKKYGTVGRLLGTGASGSVNLVTSKVNPEEIFAVKKFRTKLSTESEHDYKVKVKNEFKIGQYLKHENLINTIELIKENEHKASLVEYYIIMEYCPYDFFNLVMSGLMSREECACYFKQIVNGVLYLQDNGLAHRDLKLDNCVVNDNGILKLIDFGSAVQYRKEKSAHVTSGEEIDKKFRLIKARGVVGSDPYLAPEVLEAGNLGYDPRGADVWSIAIIYCCMILKRFPWKIPKFSDPSYKSFVFQPSGSEVDKLANNVNENMNVSPGLPKDKKIPKGPDRLLRLLPPPCRPLIKRMLIIEPEKRYTIRDVVNDEFYLTIDHCHNAFNELKEKLVHKGDDHVHHLITEEDLKKLNMEKERQKRLKEAGVA